MLEPKPKSICMAPSVAVCCGLSSKRLRTDGSNDVSELHSKGLGRVGEEVAGEGIDGRDGSAKTVD